MCKYLYLYYSLAYIILLLPKHICAYIKEFTFFQHPGKIKDYFSFSYLTITEFFLHVSLIYLGDLRQLIAKDISTESYLL